jgi:hypothetical protein
LFLSSQMLVFCLLTRRIVAYGTGPVLAQSHGFRSGLVREVQPASGSTISRGVPRHARGQSGVQLGWPPFATPRLPSPGRKPSPWSCVFRGAARYRPDSPNLDEGT